MKKTKYIALIVVLLMLMSSVNVYAGIPIDRENTDMTMFKTAHFSLLKEFKLSNVAIPYHYGHDGTKLKGYEQKFTLNFHNPYDYDIFIYLDNYTLKTTDTDLKWFLNFGGINWYLNNPAEPYDNYWSKCDYSPYVYNSYFTLESAVIPANSTEEIDISLIIDDSIKNERYVRADRTVRVDFNFDILYIPVSQASQIRFGCP